jgi:hypothetical protein
MKARMREGRRVEGEDEDEREKVMEMRERGVLIMKVTGGAG